MKRCPTCNQSNLEGVLFCDNCGEVLIGVQSTSTQQIKSPTDELGGKVTWGTARFSREASVVLHFRDESDPISLSMTDETTIGRADSTSNVFPTLDLTPFGARDKGVSRMHATIRRGEETLMLVDLGSVNGTYLNGQRLIPNQPRVLRDGDEVRFGTLVGYVYFK